MTPEGQKIADALRDTKRLIEHLRGRVDELAQSRHRNAEAAWKAEKKLAEMDKQFSDAAAWLADAMGYREAAQ